MRCKIWLIFFIVVLAAYLNLPKLPFALLIPKLNIKISDLTGNFPIKLGLDLQGGVQLVLEAQMDKIEDADRDDALKSARAVIERRVNMFGVAESLVQTSRIGEKRRIIVDLPGIKDASQAASLVGQTARLEIRQLQESTNSATPSAFISYETTIPTGIAGTDLKRAQVTFGGSQNTTSGVQVAIEFTSAGAEKFAQITKRNIGKQLPIFLDNFPISAPVVQQEILGGSAVITGNFTTDEAKRLSIQLNAGALPVPVKIVEQRLIGPTLGEQSINKSFVAGTIGLITVLAYMAIFYGLWGIIADLALILYSLFVLAIFRTGLFIMPPVTLTLAGIAGFVLSIGMAVDANILIFERIKEELRWGKHTRLAFDLGFQRAWSSIRDSNISSLMTAGILFFLATGPVKGFAITLAIGVLVSMFTAITITKTVLKFIIK